MKGQNAKKLQARPLEFERADSQTLRWSCREYEGRTFLEVRHFYRNHAGDLCPTQKGATIRLSELEQVIDWLLLLRAQMHDGESPRDFVKRVTAQRPKNDNSPDDETLF